MRVELVPPVLGEALKILVIDDDEAFRATVVKGLEKLGFEALQAASGGLGLKLAREHAPELILCDVRMAGADGFLTLYALRRDPQIAATPFVLISGQPVTATDVPGLEHGADGLLAKPFSVEQLRKTIETVLANRPVPNAQLESKLEQLRKPGSESGTGLLEPLQEIIGVANLVRESHEQLRAKELTGLMDEIRQSASGLERRIGNCLTYAEAELLASDEDRLSAIRQERTKLCSTVEPLARQMAERRERSADLALELADTLVVISPKHLAKIIEELLDNAFRYSQPGEAITLKSRIEIGAVILSVSDQGRGMSLEKLSKVGAPISMMRLLYGQQGSGLGLIIAKRLVELYGGSFQIESQPEAGTTVTLKLSLPSS